MIINGVPANGSEFVVSSISEIAIDWPLYSSINTCLPNGTSNANIVVVFGWNTNLFELLN